MAGIEKGAESNKNEPQKEESSKASPADGRSNDGTKSRKEPLDELVGDHDGSYVSKIQSLCMQCREQGETRMLLVNIPFFRDIVVMSFECEHCGFKNNDIQMARELQEKAVKFTLKISSADDMDRMVVVNQNARVYIPEIDFDVPKVTKALVSTVQGMFEIFVSDLQQHIEYVKETKGDTSALESFVSKLQGYGSAQAELLPYYIIITDYTGNSFVSRKSYTANDNNLRVDEFYRTKEQLIELGYLSEDGTSSTTQPVDTAALAPKAVKLNDIEAKNVIREFHSGSRLPDAHKLDHSKPIQEQQSLKDVTEIPVDCYACFKPGHLRMCQIEIPFFKEILIMSFNCEHCGFKNTDIKPGGSISEKGKRITLKVTAASDLDRDIFKSESVAVFIPELELEVSPGTLGSFYTTVEGFVDKVIENLSKENPFVGDSAEQEHSQNFAKFIERLTQLKEGKILPFTFVMDDPLDNCFILNPFYPDPDTGVAIEQYERTSEQNEDLGLNQASV